MNFLVAILFHILTKYCQWEILFYMWIVLPERENLMTVKTDRP